ncbi:alpha/beta hydrolase [Pseudoclavibacter sp. AY1F1]|uniref:alpha/beta fold hydrolase n=1 Tax=Pseudoclavibacter sp. AY1F1 TaxID=2080583 RepID=UPI000CE74085|nr:alpha/beta hydrolase [Pseudoclavibacter sp. AY1F1]PPF46924.1 alpha/beta hydrolase [Pseudoclavibacter sp. AY1F1]
MKKFVKTLLKIVAAGCTLIAVALVATTSVNAVASGIEGGRIEAYGQRVAVDGRQMNVVVAGDAGDTVVLLPGFGTAAPALDFQPLVDDLAKDHRVIVVEPFGYGLSDGTDRERTTENIVTEVHSALQALGAYNYVLMGHSIAGIYGLEYAERYPDEVTAFVGIDTSVPGQPGMDTQFPTGLFAAVKNLGLMRLVAAVGGVGYELPAYSDEAREQIALISNRNSLSPSYLDEMAHISTNFEDALGAKFPEQLPLLLFVEADNSNNPDWIGLHERQASEVADGTVIPIDGEHYLHQSHAAEIAADFRAWADERV